jgi:hypothetical protein
LRFTLETAQTFSFVSSKVQVGGAIFTVAPAPSLFAPSRRAFKK